MSARVALTHVIDRRFTRPVAVGTHWLRLRPAPHASAHVTAYSLRVRTEPHFVNWTRDAFENHVARLDLPEPVRSLTMEVDLVAELGDASPFDFLVDAGAAEHPFDYEPQLAKELVPYLHLGRPGAALAAWLASLERRPRYVVDRLEALTRAVYDRIPYDPADPTALPDADAALARGAGTAADLAWLLTLALRAVGIAARYAMGYHVTTGGGTATADLHAWSEAFLPGAGWIGLDPAAGLFATSHHVPLACAPDPLHARPVMGFREWCEETAHETLAARVLEPAAPAWPHPEPEWAAIRTLGETVDERLASAGVALAVGREIAFVSAAHAGAPEWTTAADGAEKRAVAQALARVLGTDVVPGALVQTCAGDWYAGELAPRWRLLCVARADGHPVWREAALLGVDCPPPATGVLADVFAGVLARALDVDPGACRPAYEDPLGRRGHAATGPEPAAADLADPRRRRLLVDVLSERLAGAPVGTVLPLAWDHGQERWRTGTWKFRRCRIYLLEGSLPMGFRLPLESLPVATTPAGDAERCAFGPHAALGDFHALAAAYLADPRAPATGDAAAPRTAVCIERRDGRLHVFLPPLVRAEHYLALVAAVESTAAATATAVVVEGYGPPADPRLRTISVEPDVGVLRVGLPGSARWTEHAATLERVYVEGERLGLRAERWLADGVREPIGAVAPLVLGGPTPDESPFLDRPELLGALVVHWQRHPSLSYLFATRLIGPSGMSVRPDEGRDDALHELAIALGRIPAGEGATPWLVDRLLRHLLADRTGDLRRAEIGLDRLYDPVRASRRLGDVVVRAFDTAPAARMAALESLLAMALVARFARDPRAGELARFGTSLHDRWLLPTVLWHDLRDVLRDLEAAGMPFALAWFEPVRALHFPLLGRAQIGEAALELRPAREPWPVLAEEVTAHGVTRFLDTANERLEMRATGLTPGRHVLACNGRRVPLRPTGLGSEWVAGVRYKAWRPVATLHPTTWPVGALVFDLIDAWNGTVLGGCRFVPTRPPPVGPVASPTMADDGPPGGGHPPRLPVAARPWQPAAGGRFSVGGSGLGPVAVPDQEHGVDHLLDLTVPA